MNHDPKIHRSKSAKTYNISKLLLKKEQKCRKMKKNASEKWKKGNFNINQLIYVSHVPDHFSKTEFRKNTVNIVNTSNLYNFFHGITGALMTDGAVYAQVIEGSVVSIKSMYSKLLHDERHCNMLKLQQTVTHVRLLRQWSMAFIEVEDLESLHGLNVQSAPQDLRKACILILRSLRPILLE